MKRFLGIVPKLFDSVDIAFFNRENMYNCRKIVDKNPRAAAKTFCMRGANADGFDDFFLDAVGDTRNVGGRSACADDEKVSARVLDFAEVKLYDVKAFDVLHGFDDSGVDGRRLVGNWR